MEENLKQLLLKDLCARLPYGVKCKYNCVVQVETFVAGKHNFIGELNGIVPLYNGHIGFMVDCDKIDALEGNIKPYLRPMSNMTEEEKNGLKEYLDAEEVDCNGFGYSEGGTFEDYISSIPYSICIGVVDWLNAHHFDFRNLIECGLAIDCTDLNIY